MRNKLARWCQAWVAATTAAGLIFFPGCSTKARPESIDAAKEAAKGPPSSAVQHVSTPVAGAVDNIAQPPTAASIKDIEVKAWHTVQPLRETLAQLPTVFWEPDDTSTLRSWLASDAHLTGKRVLEIGSGTGLVALCCVHYGAERVTALDINPYAIINTSYNADRLGLSDRLDVWQVPSLDVSPYSVLQADQKFDFIISNPPWEDAPVHSLDQYALYDPGLRLCDHLLNESGSWLKPDGKLILVYGAKQALELILSRAPRAGWQVTVRDTRQLASLPEVFVPGVLLELSR